jgi:hypothetical protein
MRPLDESDRTPDGELKKYGEFKQVYFGRLVRFIHFLSVR